MNGELSALYRRYLPMVLARCRRLLISRAQAEDAAQDIFLKILALNQELPPQEGRARWILRVTTNYCLNLLRDERRHQQALEPPDSGGAPFSDPVADRQLVRRLIASLPEDVGLVGWLNHVDELDQSDIAARLRVSRRTVVARLAAFNLRARRALDSL
ncbi:MAG TPA: sigma-70 family RNA polymerase sigma factor [Polyangiaceae bacterium]|nr:sigma-70 family RNA polymerase sigma factor [Polyangiaceae bacterium]